MSTHDHDVIRAHLLAGERLLWSGRPIHGVRIGLSGVWLMIIGPLVVAALALIWTILITLLLRGNLVVVVFMIVAALLTYALIIEQFIDAWRRQRVLYALSDQRAIVIEGILRRRVRSLPINMIVEILWKERADQIGTIHCISPLHTWHRKNKRGVTKPAPLFRLVVNVRHVRDLLIDARQRSSGNLPFTVTERP